MDSSCILAVFVTFWEHSSCSTTHSEPFGIIKKYFEHVQNNFLEGPNTPNYPVREAFEVYSMCKGSIRLSFGNHAGCARSIRETFGKNSQRTKTHIFRIQFEFSRLLFVSFPHYGTPEPNVNRIARFVVVFEDIHLFVLFEQKREQISLYEKHSGSIRKQYGLFGNNTAYSETIRSIL